MKVAIINYGMGNIGSVRRALENLGVEPYVAEYPEQLHSANRIILPGVGSFSEGMQALVDGGWVQELNTEVLVKKKPLLGICLGMQLLAERGYEGEPTNGLGYLSGSVKHLNDLKCLGPIPHVGWNEINKINSAQILRSIPDATDLYFVHSYAYDGIDATQVIATAQYEGALVAAVVGRDHIMGTQFHPEKSSRAGVQILNNFIEFSPC